MTTPLGPKTSTCVSNAIWSEVGTIYEALIDDDFTHISTLIDQICQAHHGPLKSWAHWDV